MAYLVIAPLLSLLIGVLYRVEANLGYSITRIDLIALVFKIFYNFAGGNKNSARPMCLAFSSFGKQCKTNSETTGHLASS